MGRMPLAFFGHGSPMVALQTSPISEGWARIAASIPRPKAILCISAHWETRGTIVTGMSRPRTIHDFSPSFPQALFDVRYPAPGEPALAARVMELLKPTRTFLDTDRWGLDHGTWSVLAKAFPDAEIPVVQLSQDFSLSPVERLEIGRRLAPLRDEGVLIAGSGNIVHNLSAMDWENRDRSPYDWAERFLNEIRDAVGEDDPDRVANLASLGPDAVRACPTPEHLWPLLYVLGARFPGEDVHLINDRIEHGSLAMTCVVVGQMAETKKVAA